MKRKTITLGTTTNASTLANDLVKSTSNVPAPDKESKPKMFKGYTFGSNDNYPHGSNIIRRSYTLAAFKVAGLLNITPKTGVTTRKEGGSMKVFQMLTNGKTKRTWPISTIEDGSYIKKAQSAMSGDASNDYNGEVKLINQIADAMLHGCKDGILRLKDKNLKKLDITLYEVSTTV